MKTSQKTISSITLSVIVTTLVVGTVVYGAWNDPTATPPDDNTPTPINVSANPQIKAGSLAITSDLQVNIMRSIAPGNNTFFGNVGIGTTNPTSKLTVNGTIESTSGGIKFPDGTVQTTKTPAAVDSCYAGWGGVWKTVNGRTVYVRPMAVIGDGAMDDYGPSAAGDALYVFCVSDDGGGYGVTGVCLTGEYCPWG